MKKASEMRAIAEAKIEENIQKKRNKANALVEGTISNLISARASKGHFNILFYVNDKEVDIKCVIELMQSFGYTIDRDGNHLIIRW